MASSYKVFMTVETTETSSDIIGVGEISDKALKVSAGDRRFLARIRNVPMYNLGITFSR